MIERSMPDAGSLATNQEIRATACACGCACLKETAR
jgi:hypothetical protein